ncbi:MAG: transporter ATP-binding protein [Marmoricola sp.]|nr:transporter ATP-binding protein [Marmoricola sp.]
MPRLSPRRIVPLAALALTAAALGATGLAQNAVADAPPYTVQTLHFKVNVGPTGSKACDVIGDLYLPSGASSANRVPAILTSNGFGGSKDDQAGIGKAFSERGYAVLSYSGLGFGGSTCQVTLDDPDYDGLAGKQLVSYLGGASGIAYTDAAHKTPAPVLDVIKQDPVAHNGQVIANDPRVGMIGGSYGGQNQFAIASVDPRVDTIVPIITWNDLSYSLAPNNTDQTTGVTSSNSGATKLTWGLFFSADGILDGLENAQADPGRLFPCPNFATFVCPALVNAGALGYMDAASATALRHASVASYMSRITIPTLLMQGETDTLFNLNEGIANYQALKAQGTPVKMIWQSWGHSDSTPAPGEISLGNPDPATQYETGRVADWFDHYLKDSSVGTGPEFAYFRNWVDYSGIATPAYATSDTFPVGAAKSYFLSAGKSLVTSPAAIAKGSQTLVTPPAGAPEEYAGLDALGAAGGGNHAEVDWAGTYADYLTPALTSTLDVVGSPKVTLQVSAPIAAKSQALKESGQLVLFVRIQDVPPGGKGRDINYLTAPVRIADVTKPFTVTLPAFVHRFPAGDRIRLIVSGSSLNYRGGLLSNPVTITTGSTSQVLTLPIVD